MPDIIQLLPDSVANQIAAGEVVQRPASVVKELVENAIDAGATRISLIVKDAGKTLIQVTDNGSGMSETDARMCFERHATSKIKKSEDIFHITTKGFRGEAMASIAAIAQVEMKTRMRDAQLGTLLEIEASKLKQQQPVQCPEGTTIQVKNLFYNVPARRYFLKSEAVEMRHIIDEFQRVALTHPEIEFNLTHNGSEVFNLPKVPLRQRIVHIFGPRYNEKLVPVEESTDIVVVDGFIGKPEAAKRTRGEQFFFVNNRFIKNTYLNHAVMSAFQEVLPGGSFPLYLLYLTIDPAQIDINIHPTKTEIKFQDDRSIYAILHAAVRRALGRFSIAPSMDFDQEMSINLAPPRQGQEIKQPVITVDTSYNPFQIKQEKESAISGWFRKREEQTDGWKDMLQINREIEMRRDTEDSQEAEQNEVVQTAVEFGLADDVVPIQMQRKYIVYATRSGLVVMDQQRAHQRILFEKYKSQFGGGKVLSQQLLFPESIQVSMQDDVLLEPFLGNIKSMGFELNRTSPGNYEILSVPMEVNVSDTQKVIDEFLNSIKIEGSDFSGKAGEQLSWAMATSSSVKYGQMLTQPEMVDLIEQLSQCEMPYSSKNKKPIFIQLTTDQLDQQFR